MTKFRLSESKAKQAWTLPNVRNFDRRSKSRLLTLLVLLLTAVTGAWAQTETYTVTLDDGNVDTQNWTITPAEATDPGVTEGQTVTLTYNGTREVKSITAKVEVIPVGAIKGKFTINNTGKQVYFAKGNLQAVCTSADNDNATHETFTWKFAENQWDCVGNNAANNSIDGNRSVSAAGTVDLFGWSTADTYYGIHNSTTAGDYSGEFVDWGGTIGTGWFTLSSDEWTYLFNTRSASTVGGTANGRYAKAKVNNVQGVILFPDTYTHPDGVTAPTGVNREDNTGWNGNNYSSADWTKMESAGCVFLPGAGYRNGSTVDVLGAYGYYWSATANNTDRAYCVNFFSGYLIPADNYSRFFGCCVRLVRQVTE